MTIEESTVWQLVRKEAELGRDREVSLSKLYREAILGHSSFSRALSFILSDKLACINTSSCDLDKVFEESFAESPALISYAISDLNAVLDRDPACDSYLLPLLFFKGFHGLQVHRVSNYLWNQGREHMALLLQSLSSLVFGIDIHPAATIGSGIQFDHATGIVIGETCVIGDNVTIMQNVTLGGTGNEVGDRHPKVDHHVLISAGAIVLGNIHLGAGAKIAAGSVVLKDVAPHTTVAGIPAKTVGNPKSSSPAHDLSHNILDDIRTEV